MQRSIDQVETMNGTFLHGDKRSIKMGRGRTGLPGMDSGEQVGPTNLSNTRAMVKSGTRGHCLI
ncbi:NAC domain-containing protein 68 [Phtheirospermum japonicum]|uniref:NAC domain-containing protein 68 n=1 Tax=Phtheirospermum japonicum TaxID=374723 RepID=A0A830CVP4_9LAMI|nr:NAC domain-containing protein 68 [Phtheirospermum japonicum]